ncbi:hypothetical protein ULF88_02940 [Halopseudomonas pachastrellae]|nr:hypothetical protein [Halopseudomonas pachastrellae]
MLTAPRGGRRRVGCLLVHWHNAALGAGTLQSDAILFRGDLIQSLLDHDSTTGK